jgi:hypothetical protein
LQVCSSENTGLQLWSSESNTALRLCSPESNTGLQVRSSESNTGLQLWSSESNTALRLCSPESNTGLQVCSRQESATSSSAEAKAVRVARSPGGVRNSPAEHYCPGRRDSRSDTVDACYAHKRLLKDRAFMCAFFLQVHSPQKILDFEITK